MNKINETFDNMMRSALSGIGTSQSFTRRLMVRIEKEKEMARVAQLSRLNNRIAFSVLIIALVGLMMVLTMVSSMEFNPDMLENAKNSLYDYFSTFCLSAFGQAYPPIVIFKIVTVVLGVVAVFSLDKVLKKEFSQK